MTHNCHFRWREKTAIFNHEKWIPLPTNISTSASHRITTQGGCCRTLSSALIVHKAWTAGNRGVERRLSPNDEWLHKTSPEEVFYFYCKREKFVNGLALLILQPNQIPTRQDPKKFLVWQKHVQTVTANCCPSFGFKGLFSSMSQQVTILQLNNQAHLQNLQESINVFLKSHLENHYTLDWDNVDLYLEALRTGKQKTPVITFWEIVARMSSNQPHMKKQEGENLWLHHHPMSVTRRMRAWGQISLCKLRYWCNVLKLNLFTKMH